MTKTEKIIVSLVAAIAVYNMFSLLFGIAELSAQGGLNAALFFRLLGQNVGVKLVMSLCASSLVFLWDSSGMRGTKATTVGDGQHGSARFATPAEITRQYKSVVAGREQTAGIVLSKERDIWRVDMGEDSLMLLAPPGTGKTKSIILPNIIYNACIMKNNPENAASMIILDNKGEALSATAGALRAVGYKTPYLDFRHPLKSYSYNLLINVNTAIDGYRAAQNEADKLLYYAQAEKYAKILSASIISNISTHKSSSESFFDDTSKGLLTGMILLVSEYGGEGERHIISVFKLIIELNGLAEGSTNTLQKSKLEDLLKSVDNERITNYVGAATKADNRTSMNIFSSALSHLVDFLDSELEQMVCNHSPAFGSGDFAAQPTAIYIVCPDDNTTRHFFASLFIRNLMNDLIAQADDASSHRLPRPVLCVWDEFGNCPPIKDIDALITAARSRGIRFILSLQSLSQLVKVYGRDISEIIRDAVQTVAFSRVAPTSEQTANTLSKLLGTRTVLSASESRQSGKKSLTNMMIGKPLMSPDELTKIPIGEFIVMKAGAYPARLKTPMLSSSIRNLPPFTDIKIIDIRPIKFLTSAQIRTQTTGALRKGMFD